MPFSNVPKRACRFRSDTSAVFNRGGRSSVQTDCRHWGPRFEHVRRFLNSVTTGILRPRRANVSFSDLVKNNRHDKNMLSRFSRHAAPTTDFFLLSHFDAYAFPTKWSMALCFQSLYVRFSSNLVSSSRSKSVWKLFENSTGPRLRGCWPLLRKHATLVKRGDDQCRDTRKQNIRKRRELGIRRTGFTTVSTRALR